MKSAAIRCKDCFSNKRFLISFISGIVMLVVSCVINYYAGTYAAERASNYVNDIVLSNIPVFDVDAVFVFGPFVLWLIVAVLCLHEPKRIPFVLKSIALFVVIRSIFITLTHIGPFPDHDILDRGQTLVKDFTFGADLFFSAHTGLPYLMALVFWDNTFLRRFFTITAVFFGVIVLMGHLHYTIDVLSAFFITYTIYHLATIFFKKDKTLFDEGLPLP